jgi:hypothetical protein
VASRPSHSPPGLRLCELTLVSLAPHGSSRATTNQVAANRTRSRTLVIVIANNYQSECRHFCSGPHAAKLKHANALAVCQVNDGENVAIMEIEESRGSGEFRSPFWGLRPPPIWSRFKPIALTALLRSTILTNDNPPATAPRAIRQEPNDEPRRAAHQRLGRSRRDRAQDRVRDAQILSHTRQEFEIDPAARPGRDT